MAIARYEDVKQQVSDSEVQSSSCLDLDCSACCNNMIMILTAEEASSFVQKIRENVDVQVIELPGRKGFEFRLNWSCESGVYVQAGVKRSREGRIIGVRPLQSFAKNNPNKQVRIYISGQCPMIIKNESGQKICSIYNHPSRPSACSNFSLGSSACTELQRSNNIISIDKIQVNNNENLEL